MQLRTRIKIITKKKSCFQKFIQPYLFMADEGKQKTPQPPPTPQTYFVVYELIFTPQDLWQTK